MCGKGTQSVIQVCSACTLVRVPRGEYDEMKKENDRLNAQNIHIYIHTFI